LSAGTTEDRRRQRSVRVGDCLLPDRLLHGLRPGEEDLRGVKVGQGPIDAETDIDVVAEHPAQLLSLGVGQQIEAKAGRSYRVGLLDRELPPLVEAPRPRT
jgi:hypothetical protein